MVFAALAVGPDNTRKSLQAWGAYLVRMQSESVTIKSAKLEHATTSVETLKAPTVAELDTTATLHSPTCRCSLCSGLGTSSPLMSGTGVVEVNINGELSEEDLRIVEKLKERDAEVRRHEQAHLAAAGQHALGGPSYTYQVGPDGQRYAIGGSVQIDLSPVPNDPEATVRKAQQLQQAALAPSNPSSTDRQVAMMASRMAQEALREIAEEQRNPQNEEKAGAKAGEKTEDQSRQKNRGLSETQAAGRYGAQRSTDSPTVEGAKQNEYAVPSGYGASQPDSSQLAAASFASSLTSTGLDIYV